MPDTPEFYAADRNAWRQWLADNHATQTSIWLLFDKGPARTMSYPDIVKEALCFGWIDSVGRKHSDTQSKLYVSRRKPRSVWSKINKQYVTQLQADGLMMPAGLHAITIAKANGSWDSLNHSDNLTVPEELADQFAKNPQAAANYEAFPPSSKRIILEWIYAAKRPETKHKRIEETVLLAAQNLRANHYRQPKGSS